MPDSSADRDALELLAEEFVARFRSGERPSLSEYACRLPDRAEEVRDLFPTLVEMEQLKPVAADQSGDHRATVESADPQRVGEFRILRRVGVGGMGTVYEAVQESLGRHVALKLLPAESLADPKRLERFRREAKAAARLHHTNIVPVFGTGEADGRHYYAMQFIAGHPLDAVIDELRRLKSNSAELATREVSEVAAALRTGTFVARPADLPAPRTEHGRVELASSVSSSFSGNLSEGHRSWAAIARVGAQVADALAYAHGQGVLHRDVKPSNLLLDLNGTVWVTDFGLAKSDGSGDLTERGDIVGTLRYLAPERFDGPGDQRADSYALGLTLYELLTLRPAFAAENRAKLVEQVAAASPRSPRSIDPAIPRDLETIVLKATARDSALRYQTAAELANDLRRYVEDRPIRARRAGAVERLWRWCRRNPTVAALTVAVGMLLLTVAVVALVGYARTSTALASVERERTEAVQARDRANANLYRSLVGEIRATRTAGGVGYRRRVWELLKQARDINTAEYDPVVLRQEAVGCLGDFTGLPPADQPAFPARICALGLRPGTEEAAFGLEDGTILVRHRLNGAESARLAGPQDAVRDLTFTPDGQRLAAVSRGGKITLWEARSAGWGAGRAVGDAPGGRQALVLPGGRFLAVPAGSTVTVRDLDGGSPAPPFVADSPVAEVVLSADGAELIGATGAGLIVWNVTSRQVTRRVPQDKFVGHLAVSSNGLFLAYSVGDTGLVVLDAKTYRQRTMRLGGDVSQLAFDPAGAYLAAASYQDRAVPIWDVMANAMVARLTFGSSEPRRLAFSADRRTLVVAGFDRAQSWDLQAADEKRTWSVHTDGVCGMNFSPDGRRLVSTSHDRTAIIWDVATGQPRLTLTGFRGPVQDAAFSADGRLLATADQEGPVRLWLAETGEELPAIPDLPWQHSFHVEFSPGGDYLAATGDGLAVWRCAPDSGRPGGLSLQRVASVPGTRSLYAAFSPDGQWLAWVDQNTKVHIWDVTHRRDSPCGAPAMLTGWRGLEFQPGTHLLYFTARSGQLTCWEVDKNRPGVVIGPTIFRQIWRFAAFQRMKDAVSLWDAGTNRELFTLPQERNTIWGSAWSPTGSLFAVGLCSGEVVVWDIDRVRARLAELGLDP